MELKNLFNVELEEFDKKVIAASHQQPVLVDFWAEWCAPCRIIAPVLKQVAEEFEDELLIAKLEVDKDDNMKLAGRYQVRGFPTVILFKAGEEQDRFSSAQSFSFIEQFVQPYLS